MELKIGEYKVKDFKKWYNEKYNQRITSIQVVTLSQTDDFNRLRKDFLRDKEFSI